MPPAQTLLIRADADVQIGTGHVMRCLALAQAWQDAGGRVTFLSAALPPALAARLRAEGITVTPLNAPSGSQEDAGEAVHWASQIGAEWIIVDGYHFDADYSRRVKRGGAKLLLFDDNGGLEYYWADLVLNQNIHARAASYGHRSPHTQLLLGTQYALLRREFQAWQGRERKTPEIASHILVTLGGSDPDNVTRKVIAALSLVSPPDLETTVVIGGGNPHRANLEAEAENARFPIRLVTNAPNMPELMAEADLAIAAAGSTVWELTYLGVPSLLIVTAENQQGIAQGMDAAGAAQSLGEAGILTEAALAEGFMAMRNNPARRAEMSRLSRQIVDGQGAARVLSECANQ